MHFARVDTAALATRVPKTEPGPVHITYASIPEKSEHILERESAKDSIEGKSETNSVLKAPFSTRAVLTFIEVASAIIAFLIQKNS